MRTTSRIQRIVRYAATAVVLLGAAGASTAGELSGDITPKLSGPALMKELQKGGYVIYFRHGATAEVGEKDVAEKDMDDCARQRPLSEVGVTQTKEIGAAFRALQIPVGAVYSSPYCRCLDTARNIFGKSAVKEKALHFAIQLRTAERAMVTARLLNMLATVPSAGTNTGLVSHTENLQEAVGVWPKPEGVAHVFKPKGDGTFTYVGVMQPEMWMLEAKRAGADGGQASGGGAGWLEWLKKR